VGGILPPGHPAVKLRSTTRCCSTTMLASEALGRGVDRFFFRDSGYNSGDFVRADRKRFPVRRMK